MNILKVFSDYKKALEEANFEMVFNTLSDDIRWHMGGQGELSGLIVGKKDLEERFSEFAQRSNGTFKVITKWAASNDNFVCANVISIAERNGSKLNMNGIDLFKIEKDKIVEVWTFAEFQSDEDEFWKKDR